MKDEEEVLGLSTLGVTSVTINIVGEGKEKKSEEKEKKRKVKKKKKKGRKVKWRKKNINSFLEDLSKN